MLDRIPINYYRNSTTNVLHCNKKKILLQIIKAQICIAALALYDRMNSNVNANSANGLDHSIPAIISSAIIIYICLITAFM